MGRRAKPEALKAAAGNPGKRRRKAGEGASRADQAKVSAVASADAPPDWLGKEAVRVWREVLPMLSRNRFFAETDRLALGRYCVHFAEWIAARDTISVEGSTQIVRTVAGDDMARVHPAVKIRNDAERHLLALEDRFGLNPSARFSLSMKLLGEPGLGEPDLFSTQPGAAPAGDGAPDPLAHFGHVAPKPH